MQGIEEGLTVGGESTAVAELGVAAAMEDGREKKKARVWVFGGRRFVKEGARASGRLGGMATLANRQPLRGRHGPCCPTGRREDAGKREGS